MSSNPLLPLNIIILNWNLPNETIECIQSIQSSSYPDVHIILVDNGSADASVQLFRDHFGTSITLMTNPVNLGFATGVNVGIQQALARGAQSILLLNNDTTVDPTMVEHLLATASQHPQVGLVGPVIYYSERRNQIWRVGDRESRWLPFPVRLTDRFVVSSIHSDFRLDYITACGMFITRQVLEKVGLFDESYFMYYEDADYCQRVRRAGYEVWCSAQAKMWHKVSVSADKQKPYTRYLQSWGRTKFYATYKHGGSWLTIALYLILRAIGLTFRDALTGNWALIYPLWIGILDGFTHRPERSSDFFKKTP